MEGRPCWCEVEDGEAMAVVGCQEEEASLGGVGGGGGAKAMMQ